LRGLRSDILQQRDRDLVGEGQVELAGNKGEDRSRAVGDDRIFDAVEIGPARFPIIGIADELDCLARLELDKFERAGADRMLPHVARRDMAGIDGRIAGGEQSEDRWLRPLQHKGGRGGAVGGDFRNVVPPRFARIEAQPLGSATGQQVPGAFDVGGSERLAVMPSHPLAQLEGQPGPLFVPRPAVGQVGNDGIETVLYLVLVVHHEVVEHRHHRDRDRVGAFLVDRHARWAVAVINPQHSAGLLRLCSPARHRHPQQTGRGDTPKVLSANSIRSPRADPSRRIFCIILGSIHAGLNDDAAGNASRLYSTTKDAAAERGNEIMSLPIDIDQFCLTLVREAPDAIIFADADGVIRLWNRGAERIFGFAEAEALGQSLDMIIPDNLRVRHWAGFSATMRNGSTRYGSGEILAVPALRKDGRRISIEFTILPFRDSHARIIGIAAMLRDVTARFEEIRTLRRQLAQVPPAGPR
jgi:PAS domain S-box-containing protein